MQRPTLRITVRSLLITTALLAVLLTLIREIERSIHRREVAALRQNEARWWGYYEDALRAGNAPSAALDKTVAEECAETRRWHEQQLGIFPRSFSAASALAVLVYGWLVALVLKLRAEWSGPPRASQSCRSVFVRWLLAGFIGPALIVALAILFERDRPPPSGKPWASYAIGILALFQLLHAMAGVLLLRGRRWQALAIGVASVIGTGVLSAFASMAVTGIWL
jgi:hypothetical protein